MMITGYTLEAGLAREVGQWLEGAIAGAKPHAW
jgi:hypothetical protein